MIAEVLNDVHSRLNPTRVARVEHPKNTKELRETLLRARSEGRVISVSGGRHAMGGQQFAADSVHLDMRGMSRVLGFDANRGLLHIEAGAQWPGIVAAARAVPPGPEGAWGIRQKQTGVDDVTLGGSISANAHGRGLMMRPLGDDIENLTLMTADGELRVCDRRRDAELFSLVIGGYGLFGVIVSATLRLSPRRRLRRIVDILDLEDAANAVFRRAAQGCLYGDFQFAIDAKDGRFLTRGVFTCYLRDDSPEATPGTVSDLDRESWLKLLKLAHENKREAFRLYASHYLATDGECYWSDSMQLATYIPGYAEFLEASRVDCAGAPESLVIGEHYVPRERTADFMLRAREILRSSGVEVIYGTIRSILRDKVSFLPWAKEDYGCVIFNLRTPHTEEGKARTAAAFRALTDASIGLGGSFFLTYHRYATPEQVEACYPRFREWLELKRRYDPAEFFTSDWYRHYSEAFACVR